MRQKEGSALMFGGVGGSDKMGDLSGLLRGSQKCPTALQCWVACAQGLRLYVMVWC